MTPTEGTPALAVELDRDALHAILDREEAASTELGRICAGGRFKMTIPTDSVNDSDILIGAALADVVTLASALTAEKLYSVCLVCHGRIHFAVAGSDGIWAHEPDAMPFEYHPGSPAGWADQQARTFVGINS